MKIKKIVINNFRAFKHVEIDLDDINCIIGKNDVGKSTIFAALEWFKKTINLNHNDYAGAAFHNNKKAVENQEDISLDDFIIYVDVYFSVEDNYWDNLDLFRYDFLQEDNCICLRKYMFHNDQGGVNPLLMTKGIIEMSNLKTKYNATQSGIGFWFKTNVFKTIGKTFSDCSIDELKSKLIEIGKNIDDICCDDEKKMKQLLCSELYQICKNNKEEFDSNRWIRNDYLFVMLHNDFEFFLFSSKTSINDYLNAYFYLYEYPHSIDRMIDNCKATTMRKLSDIMEKDGIEETFECRTSRRDFFTDANFWFKTNISYVEIPFNNRGEGFQWKIKNSIFKLFAQTRMQNNVKNTVLFAFEEPETHLHPSAQIKMYETIKELSENPNCQVLITTHSPYIVKQLSEDNIKTIVVKRDENLKLSTISKLEERVLPYISMNEINYIAFDYASEEFHQELYAYVEMNWAGHSDGNRLSNLIANVFGKKKLDSNIVIKTLIDDYNSDSKNTFTLEYNMNLFISADETDTLRYIPSCVRNSIDHPCEDNKKWKQPKVVALSIKILLEINRVLNSAKQFFIHRISEISNLDSFGDKFTCSGCDDTNAHTVVFWVNYAMKHKNIKNDSKKGFNDENERLLSNQSYLINALRLIEPNWKQIIDETNYEQ